MGTLIVFLTWLIACVIIDKIVEAKKRKRQIKRQEVKERIYRCKRIDAPEFQIKKSA